MNKAVFLDRDGVLIEDIDLLVHAEDLRILEGVPQALCGLKESGFQLHVVTNQTVVARGLLSEDQVCSLHHQLDLQLREAGAPAMDGWYFCPHHPQASVSAYRTDCDCRKPRPGLLLRAAWEHQLDLAASFLVGDRLTDIAAGARAGCRTILVETGRHRDPLIVTAEPLSPPPEPDYLCGSLGAAARWILSRRAG